VSERASSDGAEKSEKAMHRKGKGNGSVLAGRERLKGGGGLEGGVKGTNDVGVVGGEVDGDGSTEGSSVEADSQRGGNG
jgi:hypothetical protein